MLYNRVSWLVRWSVGPLVYQSVGWFIWQYLAGFAGGGEGEDVEKEKEENIPHMCESTGH